MEDRIMLALEDEFVVQWDDANQRVKVEEKKLDKGSAAYI